MRYYVNMRAQLNGDHEVHVPGCAFFPDSENALDLGDFTGCHSAVAEARKHYSQSNGCYYCCNACHTS